MTYHLWTNSVLVVLREFDIPSNEGKRGGDDPSHRVCHFSTEYRYEYECLLVRVRVRARCRDRVEPADDGRPVLALPRTASHCQQ